MDRTELYNLFEEAEIASAGRRSVADSFFADVHNIVLVGAGKAGRRMATRMSAEGFHIACFADNNSKLHGEYIFGIQILPFDEAVKRFAGKAMFVVSAFSAAFHSDYRQMKRHLAELGAKQIVAFPTIAWMFPGLLPYYLLGLPEDISPHRDMAERIYGLLSDERSRRVFVDMLRMSLTGDVESTAPWDNGPMYFIPEVLDALPDSIIMADCGAYDGDTLRAFLEVVGQDRLGHYYAFEPDPANFSNLLSFIETLPKDLSARVSPKPLGLGKTGGEVTFNSMDGTNATCSACSTQGNVLIELAALDDVLAGKPCNFIKMDIEGSELDALHGAVGTVRDHAPVMAISVYHKPSDVIKIPSFFNMLLPPPPAKISITRHDKYILRNHMANMFETIFYRI